MIIFVKYPIFRAFFKEIYFYYGQILSWLSQTLHFIILNIQLKTAHRYLKLFWRYSRFSKKNLEAPKLHFFPKIGAKSKSIWDINLKFLNRYSEGWNTYIRKISLKSFSEIIQGVRKTLSKQNFYDFFNFWVGKQVGSDRKRRVKYFWKDRMAIPGLSFFLILRTKERSGCGNTPPPSLHYYYRFVHACKPDHYTV